MLAEAAKRSDRPKRLLFGNSQIDAVSPLPAQKRKRIECRVLTDVLNFTNDLKIAIAGSLRLPQNVV